MAESQPALHQTPGTTSDPLVDPEPSAPLVTLKSSVSTESANRAAAKGKVARERGRDCSNPCVYIDTERWLRTHGRPPAPKLAPEHSAQLTESFKLIDSDGGGTVDAGELGAALKLLGVKAGKAELRAMLDRAGVDESAELTPGQFNRVMTEVLTKKPNLKDSPSHPNGGIVAEDEASVASCLSFETTASIYRRKKLMQALIERDHSTLETLMASAVDTKTGPTFT